MEQGTERIFRYEVPVDDEWHEVELRGGEPLFVASRRHDMVEFWAQHNDALPARRARFMVVGTGQPMPSRAAYHGTALAAGGQLVWHLLEDRSSS